MMKLSTMKLLVDSLDKDWKSPIAEKILENWEHNQGSIYYCRSSANFSFYFTNKGRKYFLRFNSNTERTSEEIQGEVELLNFLNVYSKNVVKPVLSKNNYYIEELVTEKDEYIAVVFEEAEGKTFEIEDLNENQFYIWGKSLGKLHNIMNKVPENIKSKRKTWKDHLHFVEEIVSDDKKALKEFSQIRDWANNMNSNSGLIHYDFELDNLSWKGNEINIFDFDDSAVYWFGADIVYSLRDLFGENIDVSNNFFKSFISGYTSEFELDKNFYENIQMFMRFHNLYAYARIKRSLDYTIEKDTPKWLVGLNDKLAGILKNTRNTF